MTNTHKQERNVLGLIFPKLFQTSFTSWPKSMQSEFPSADSGQSGQKQWQFRPLLPLPNMYTLSENLARIATKENNPIIIPRAQVQGRELQNGLYHHDEISRKNGQIMTNGDKKKKKGSQLDLGLCAVGPLSHTKTSLFPKQREMRDEYAKINNKQKKKYISPPQISHYNSKASLSMANYYS